MKRKTWRTSKLATNTPRRGPLFSHPVSTALAITSVAVAVPAAMFVEPVVMGIAAGAATLAAIGRVATSRPKPQSERRTGTEDRRHHAMAR